MLAGFNAPDLGARFHAATVLASDSTSRVVQARLRNGDAHVCVKQTALAGASADEKAAIARDAASVRAVQSPHVVAHFDSYLDGDWLIVVCAHAPRGDLGAMLTKRAGEPLPEDAIWALLGGILRGLSDLHAHGIVHRDLRPSSIFIGARARRARRREPLHPH